MMADGADAGAAWENPLIPNARLRQIHLAMVRARVLAQALGSRRRGGSTLGLEACLVSASVDLGPCDVVSDALGGKVVEFLRGVKLGEALGRGAGVRGPRVTANCGEAARLPATDGIAERIWMALGAAAALKAQAAQARIESRAKSETAGQSGVVVMFAMAGEAAPALWRTALTFAAKQELPVMFVVLPDARARGSKGRGRKARQMSAIAIRCGVPGIPVDADDAVAIYRVAQESIGHARIGGGPALMECEPFMVEGAGGKRSPAAAAIAGLEQYMLQRRVVTKASMEREAKSFEKLVAAANVASKER